MLRRIRFQYGLIVSGQDDESCYKKALQMIRENPESVIAAVEPAFYRSRPLWKRFLTGK